MSQNMKSIHQKLKGFISLEIALVLIISAIIGFVLIQQQARAAKKEVARVQADQLQQFADALNSYTDLYRRELVGPGNLNIDIDNNGTTDVTIPEAAPAGSPEGGKFTPTVQNLIDAGLLPQGFQNRPAASDGQFITRLSVQPPTCSVTADNCRVEGYVAINQPVTTGGAFDGDIMGDMLSFMGGNGFATIRANQPAVSSGGNFTVALDLDGNGTADTNSTAGITGMRVGALASRADVRDPIPNVDFCTGDNINIFWGTGAASNPSLATLTTNPNALDSKNVCYAVVISDTPVGYRFVQTDGNVGGSQGGPGGSALLQCVFNENANPPAQIRVLSTCCDNGNSSCTPPAPGSSVPVASSTSTSTTTTTTSTSGTTTSGGTTTTTTGDTSGNGGSNGNSNGGPKN